MGCAEPVRHRRLRLPAKLRLQSDGACRRPVLHDGSWSRHPAAEITRPACSRLRSPAMTKKKLALRVISALVVLGVVGYLAVYLATVLFGGGSGDRTAALPQPLDQQLVQRGAYVVLEGNGASCHTAPGGKPFAGGLP